MVEFCCDITARLRDIGDENADMMLNLINLFNEQYPEIRQEINASAMQKMSQQTKNAAHTLKGVCFNLGIEPMGDICKSIEGAAMVNQWDKVADLIAVLDEYFAETKKIFVVLGEEFE